MYNPIQMSANSSQIITKGMLPNTYRCKQCAKDHKRCDKKFPKCQRCINLDRSECVYITKPVIRPIIKKEKPAKVIKKKEKVNVRKRGSKLGLELRSNMKVFKLQTQPKIILNAIDMGSDGSNLYQRLYRSFPQKCSFEHLLTMSQYPQFHLKNPRFNLFINLTQKYRSIVKNLNYHKPSVQYEDLLLYENMDSKFMKEEINGALSQAYNSYFEYYNATFPLFLKKKFNFKYMDYYLKLAILLSGLGRMKKSDLVSYLIDTIQLKLYNKFKYFYTLTPSLAMIQTLFILIQSSLNIAWIWAKVEHYSDYCIRASYAIGLHLNYPKYNPKVKTERIMCYCSLMMFRFIMALSYKNTFPLPYRPKELDKQFNKILGALITGNGLNNKLHNSDPEFIYSIILISYYNELSSIIYSIKQLKEKYINYDYRQKKNDTIRVELFTRNASIKKKYCFIFLLLKIQLTNLNSKNYNVRTTNSFVQSIDQIQLRILFFHHYCNYFLFGLSFYNSMNSLNLISNFPEDSNLVVQTLLECKIYLSYAIQLNQSLNPSLDLNIINEGMVFIIGNYKHSSLNFKSILFKVMNHTNRLANSHSAFSRVIFLDNNIYRHLFQLLKIK